MIDRFEQFSISIFNISHYWNKIAAEEMKEYGLRGGYALYLIVLSRSDRGITSAKLAELCQRDKGDVSRAISTFQKAGLLEPYGKNCYRAPLILTDEGRKVVDQLASKASVLLELAGEGLTDEMRENLYPSLDLIAKNMKQISEKGPV